MRTLSQILRDRWRGDGGYRELLKVALPLIASTGMWSIQTIVDRAFLARYSNADVAASMNGSMANYTIVVLFSTTAAYANTFVAQYIGAKRSERVGLAVWQAVFFSLAAGALLFALAKVTSGVFLLFDHEADLLDSEVAYYRILMRGSVFLLAGTALSTFFSGREDTVTVMLVTLLSVVVNVILDYAWIFGRLGFPEMGIRGAAWATVVSFAVYALGFFLLILRRRYREQFGTLAGCRLDAELLRRLIRYGLPSGISGILEVAVWTGFVLVIGTYGVVEGAATAVTFSINSLAFMPMVGVGLAVSTLVGRRQGESSPHLSWRTMWSAFHLTVAYMAVYAVLIVLVPGPFIGVFSEGAPTHQFQPVARLTVVLLYYVAAYTVFDGMVSILYSALRGAGDTVFPMWTATGLSWGILLVPSLVLHWTGHGTLYRNWTLATAYIIVLAIVALFRFLGGKWRTMRVIEEEIVPPPLAPYPDIRRAEIE